QIRKADEPAASGGCRQRKDDGGFYMYSDRDRIGCTGMPHGTNRNLGQSALRRLKSLCGYYGFEDCSVVWLDQAVGQEDHPSQASCRRVTYPDRYACPAGGYGSV